MTFKLTNTRLFTFGCSFTQYMWPTWADILSKNFNFYENWALAGAGNLYIFNSIIEAHKRHQFKNDDTIIIMWSGLTRIDYYKNNSWQPQGSDFELKYNNPIIGTQRNIVKVFEDDLNDIFNSRTFCLFEDIEMIKKNGLAKGGSLENAIVVKNDEIMNKKGLRNDKEFVNHKILDCIGDLYTSGFRIVANVKCSQGGHYLTNSLLRKVFEKKDNYSIIEI